MALQVETYSGYRADERPTRFRWEDRTVEVERVLRRWREPAAECFRVVGSDGRTYELRHNGATDEWVASEHH